jgi:hypothetical protein
LFIIHGPQELAADGWETARRLQAIYTGQLRDSVAKKATHFFFMVELVLSNESQVFI